MGFGRRGLGGWYVYLFFLSLFLSFPSFFPSLFFFFFVVVLRIGCLCPQKILKTDELANLSSGSEPR